MQPWALSLPDKELCLREYGTYRIALDADRTIAALRANNGNASRSPRLDATLDMGGHTLTVLGEYAAESVWGYSSRFSRVTLTNGTFKANEVKIGAINNVIFCEPASVGQQYAFNCGSGSLIAEGPGTVVTIRKGVELMGPFTRLRVAGGASFTCDRLRAYGMQYHGTSYVKRSPTFLLKCKTVLGTHDGTPKAPHPKVPGRRRGKRGFPAAPRERPRESFFNASRGPSPLP